MERLGFRLPAETASLGYVTWDEVNVSSDKGRREVHYYLKRNDGGSDLAIIGKEKSLRHMSYHYAIKNRPNLFFVANSPRPRSRKEVVDWLDSIVSGSLPYESFLRGGSVDSTDASDLDVEAHEEIQQRQKLGHYTAEFLWLGSPWTCRKRRKHYESFCRNRVKILVHDFVYVLAEEGKRLVAYLEDMYEDSKGNKMVMVRWFHKIDEVGLVLPHNFNDREIFFSLCLQDLSIECIDGLATVLSPRHFKKFQNKAIHTRFNPFVCDQQFEDDVVKPFDITHIEGYWRQEIFKYFSFSTLKLPANLEHPINGLRQEGNDNDISRMRPKKRLRLLKDNNDVCTGINESLSTEHKNMQNWINGNEISSLGRQEHGPFLSTTEVMQKPQNLNIGSEVELLSQDSGIRGCWFRALIIKKHKDKVKVRYHDISDAAEEASKLEEWVLASRVAAPDPLAIRIGGRTVVRPIPQFNEGQAASVTDVGTAVDVWWHDAWWEGIVVHKESKDRIRVFFPGEKKESVFCSSDMRISQEWLGIGWTRVKERPDVVPNLPLCLERKPVASKSDESKFVQAAIPDTRQAGEVDSGCSNSSLDSGRDVGSALEVVPDLLKDNMLAQLRWSSLKKRRRCGGSSGHKWHHNGGPRLPEVVGSNASKRFLISTTLKVDCENCKYMGDSPFTSSVVQPLTSLVMSR